MKLNKENTPCFDPKLDYSLALKRFKEAQSAIWELESMFGHSSIAARSGAFEARVSLGSVEDHILRCLGIRGN